MPNTPTPRPSTRIKWILLFLGFTFLFIGVPILVQWRWHWFTRTVATITGIPYWTYFIPLLTAIVAALVPSWLAYFAYKKFIEERDQRQSIHDEQQKTIREQFDTKAEADKIQFERKLLEEQFNDIQNRLSDDNPAMRANAALRLAQLAETLRPGSETTEYTLQNNPFFPRATSQLCIALNMEKDFGVRTAIVDALNNLITFAKDNPGEELLDFLIPTLANANRTAHYNFLKTLAAYWVAQPQAYLGKTWEQLGVATFFCDDIELNKSILETQMQHPSFQGDYYILERKKSDASLIIDVQGRTECLKQIMGVLANCLQVRRGIKQLDLKNIFLVRAFLEGNVQLQKAVLHGAQMQQAQLWGAQLQGAILWGTQLQRAFLMGVHLEEADLSGAQLQGADLRGAHLQGANLWTTQLNGSNLLGAQLQKAKVAHSNLDEARNVDKSWREADFGVNNPQEHPLYKKLEAKFGKKEKEN